MKLLTQIIIILNVVGAILVGIGIAGLLANILICLFENWINSSVRR